LSASRFAVLPVGVALLVLASAVGCFSRRTPEADLILTNGIVHTLHGDDPPSQGLAVGRGRVLATGRDEEVLRYRGATTPVVDLKGATVIPGLIDAHVHLLGVGESLANEGTGGALYVDLSETESEEDAVQRVRVRARDLKPGEWVLGRGWNQERWTVADMPDKRLLSDIVQYNPAFLVRSDAHAVWVNKKALDLAGITARTSDPSGGRIGRLPRSSEPSGVLLDSAWEPLLRLIPPRTREEQAALAVRALRQFAAMGYTMVQSAGSMNRMGLIDPGAPAGAEADLFRDLARSGGLPIRVSLMIPGPSEAAEDLMRRGPETGLADGRLDIRTVKLFADGALGSRGAALLQPYADDPSTSGVPRMDQAAIAGWAGRGLRRGVQIAVHAIGDAAVRAAVGGFNDALASSPGAEPRFRIEHLSLFDPADVDPLVRSGAVAIVQPGFLVPGRDGPMEEKRVGEERARRIHAFGTLLQAGVPLAGSSDAYDRPPHPLAGFHAAVTRQSPGGLPPGGWHPEQRLTRLEALRLFTTGAAWAAFREQDLGSLEPGKRADFTVLSLDILVVPDDQILSTEVVSTYVDGIEVYRRERPAQP